MISHSHGVNNFKQITSNDKNIPNFYKSQCLYKHTDHFISWKSPLSDCDIWNGVSTRFNINIADIGSVYLYNLDKWKHKIDKKDKKDKKDKVLLFVGDHFRKHKIFSFENSYKEDYQRKIKIKNFLEKSLNLYENLKVIYKPFPYTYKEDPISIFIKKNQLIKKFIFLKNLLLT